MKCTQHIWQMKWPKIMQSWYISIFPCRRAWTICDPRGLLAKYVCNFVWVLGGLHQEECITYCKHALTQQQLWKVLPNIKVRQKILKEFEFLQPTCLRFGEKKYTNVIMGSAMYSPKLSLTEIHEIDVSLHDMVLIITMGCAVTKVHLVRQCNNGYSTLQKTVQSKFVLQPHALWYV